MLRQPASVSANRRTRRAPARRLREASRRLRREPGSSRRNSSTQPLAHAFGNKPARACARSELCKMMEVLRIVDIEGDSRQAHDAWLDAAGTGGGEMGKEAVLAKAQGNGVGRRHHDRIRPLVVMCRRDGKGRGWAVRGNQLLDLRRGNERKITGDRQHGAAATPYQVPRPGHYCAGM